MEYKNSDFSAMVALSVGILATGAAHAGTIIYSDLGPSNASAAAGYDVAGTAITCCGFQEVAAPFTPSSNFQFGQIDIALFNTGSPAFGDANSVVLTLNSDSNGLPGSVLESWTLTGMPNAFTPDTVQTVSASAPLTLSSGVQYWVVASPESSNSDNDWAENSVGVFSGTDVAFNSGSGFFVFGYGNWEEPAFDVQAWSSPEPGTLALDTIALLALGIGAFAKRSWILVH
jgi:hypothetical protein